MNSSVTEQLKTAIFEAVQTIETRSVGIAFSGGVDSSILAKVAKDVGKTVKLLTVSFGNGKDTMFARTIADTLKLPLIYDSVALEALEKGVKTVIKEIVFTRLVRLETCVGFYYVFQLAAAHGIPTVLSAHGLDELFCGYHVYRRAFGTEGIEGLMQSLLETAINDWREVDKIATMWTVDYICPFLSDHFVDFALKIPVTLKMNGQTDSLRKIILRKVALELGVPSSAALRPKNAFQYSSGLHKAIMRLAKQNGFTTKNAVKQGFTSGIAAYTQSLEQEDSRSKRGKHR